MNATLEAIAAAIFKSWFVDFDPVRAKMDGRQPPGMDEATAKLFPNAFEHEMDKLVPSNWVTTTIGKEASLLAGFAFKSKYFSEEPPGVRLARGDNVKEGYFHWGNKSRYWSKVTDDIERYLLQAGDVLIGMDGSKVGKNWVQVRQHDLPCLLVQRVMRIRPTTSVGASFIWRLISDPGFRFYVDGVRTGTSIPHISGAQIQAYTFVRPPVGDNRLMDKFESLTLPLTRQSDKNYNESRTLAALRDTLLPKLLSGELRVADAERVVEAAV